MVVLTHDLPMNNISDPSDNATSKQWWCRAGKSFLLSPDISPNAKILWLVIHSHGKRPVIGQDKLMASIGVAKWVTLTKYLKEIKRLVPGWSWHQQPMIKGKYQTNLYDPLPAPLSNYGQIPISKKGIPTDIQKRDNKKNQEKKNNTPSPDLSAVREILLSIPIAGEPTAGYALESETLALLNKKSREILDQGVSLDSLRALKSFYSLPTDPLNEFNRADTFPKLLRKWGTELKRAMTWIRSRESRSKPDNVVNL